METIYTWLFGNELDMRIAKRVSIALLGIGALLYFGWLGITRNPNPAFSRAIADTDRIVIRNGGFDCCGEIDSQPIILEITDSRTIAAFNVNIRFRRSVSKTSCMCCGYPGIDWYCKGRRVALTSIQHGEAIRWRGFESDEPLTRRSANWLRSFLSENEVPEIQDLSYLNTQPDDDSTMNDSSNSSKSDPEAK
ncbi:MAG: hypothetical protein H8D56_01685 [Planctomycetes bacterium]|nr:hypothetical protein [Planctomycetota bacterium]MBL7143174.1 hypothetical protein [Phycisphaerae bacterium]